MSSATEDSGASAAVGQADLSLTKRVAALQQQEQSLIREIQVLQKRYDTLLQQQTQEAQAMLSKLVSDSTKELERRRQTLQLEIEQLERRQERIQAEMRSSFAGTSQNIAVRVQGFKDYLVGSLQDLATAAEQLQIQVPEASPEQNQRASQGRASSDRPLALDPPPSSAQATVGRSPNRSSVRPQSPPPSESFTDARPRTPEARRQRRQSSSGPSSSPQVALNLQGTGPKRGFEQDAKQIQQILDQYRQSPDYYGMPWQLRRTFEPIHAQRVSQWFFDHAGRGSLKSMGSRLQNILVTSAIISVLRMMRGDRIRILILSDSPERLGEWRRGLQDCLGISRGDFGAQQGVALFEAPEAVCQRADRLVEQGNQPFILIDNSEDKVHLSLLQYPLWLAFAPDPKEIPMY